MTRVVAVDTSVAVAVVLAGHQFHDHVTNALAGSTLHLAGHAAVESYSVLTRLPVGERLSPSDARSLLREAFAGIVEPVGPLADRLDVIARAGIVGGAVYDALVALAAASQDLTLVTRDERALPTYAALGVRIELLG